MSERKGGKIIYNFFILSTKSASFSLAPFNYNIYADVKWQRKKREKKRNKKTCCLTFPKLFLFFLCRFFFHFLFFQRAVFGSIRAKIASIIVVLRMIGNFFLRKIVPERSPLLHKYVWIWLEARNMTKWRKICVRYGNFYILTFLTLLESHARHVLDKVSFPPQTRRDFNVRWIKKLKKFTFMPKLKNIVGKKKRIWIFAT